MSRENDYNYISLYHSDLGGCVGQNSLAINEYMSKLLEKLANLIAFMNGKQLFNFLSDRVKISCAHTISTS